MLRMRYMPCDFHPLLLVLGNATELLTFSGLLLKFASDGRPQNLSRVGVFTEDTCVIMQELAQESDQDPGLWVTKAGMRPVLEWRLSKVLAEKFSAEVLAIANGPSRAGSTILECQVLNEIRIKVSFGEFEDCFLLGEMW